MTEKERIYELMSARLDGALDKTGEKELEKLLASEPEYRDLMAAMDGAHRAMGREVEPPAELRTRVMAEVRRQNARKRARRRGYMGVATGLAAVAVLALAVMPGGFMSPVKSEDNAGESSGGPSQYAMPQNGDRMVEDPNNAPAFDPDISTEPSPQSDDTPVPDGPAAPGGLNAPDSNTAPGEDPKPEDPTASTDPTVPNDPGTAEPDPDGNTAQDPTVPPEDPDMPDPGTVVSPIGPTGPSVPVMPVEPEDAELVNVADYIPGIYVDLKYATEDNFTGQVIYDFTEARLRYGTVKKLMAVQAELAEQGLALKIWDACRPTSAQFKLWEICPDSRYVANPNHSGSTHSRGNTVDITVVTADGGEIEMPTGFDDFTTKADRDYSDVTETAAANARLLEDLMTAHGFKPYSAEWWHYTDTVSYDVVED